LPLELDERTATLTGSVTVDEVEPFVAWLRANPKGRVNLKGSTHLHTGALQAMLLFGTEVSAPPVDPFLAEWVLPVLAGGNAGTGGTG
jgi:hypothetical protein